MKQESPRFTRAALLCAAAFLAAPAAAQQAAPVVTPPPVATPAPPPTVATPAPTPAAPPTVAPTVDSDASTNVTGGTSDVPGADKNSTTPINPAAAAAAEEEAAARRSAARSARPASRPVATRPAASRPAPARAAPAAAAPAPAPAPTPEAATPTPEASATPAEAPTPAEVAAAPEAPVAVDNATDTQTTTTETGGSPLIWIILGVLVIAGLAAFLLSRRRRAEPDDYVEPVAVAPAEPYVEPVVAPVAAAPVVDTEAEPEPFVPAAQAETPTVLAPTEPVDIAPAVADDATVEEPEAADVAALTAGTPAGDRPWLELAMRPIRAGTNVDQALVEVELTVANAGTVQADDVRISTFMLPAGADGEMDRLLSQSRVDAAVEPLTIPAGEGTRVDATLALPRADLMANDATHFQPVVVADVRYRLPDNSEGRTSASFVVGIASDGDLGLLELDRPVLREDVEARLYRDPARI